MNLITVKAELSSTTQISLDSVLELAHFAGLEIGERKQRQLDISVVIVNPGFDEEESLLLTAPDATPRFGFLLGSVRWSVTRNEYVVVTNDFLPEDNRRHIGLSFQEGLKLGAENYKIDQLEAAAAPATDDGGLDADLLNRAIDALQLPSPTA